MPDPPVNAESKTASVPGVTGKNTASTGTGVEGHSDAGLGVYGHSKSSRGVEALSETDYGLRAHSHALAGLRSSSDLGRGVEGSSPAAEGVYGSSDSGIGVVGESNNNEGIRGVSHHIAHGGVVGINDWGPLPHARASLNSGGPGGRFESSRGIGVSGTATNAHHSGVAGFNTVGGIGIFGTCFTGIAPSPTTESPSPGGIGVFGTSHDGAGVWGTSVNNEGVHAETRSVTTAAVAAFQLNKDSDSAALYASHAGKRTAGFFDGDVIITGVIHMNRADYAEEFTVTNPEAARPGMVMVLDDSGSVSVSQKAYDTRVAGVVSGAGSYKPAVILDHDTSLLDRQPLALMGKAYCLVDATDAPVGIGDLLTTSAVPGHAMKALDPLKAFGSVIGKALQPLTGGKGLIPILVRLQ